MGSFNKEDIKWLELCLQSPDKYKIFVDNDDIFVVDVSIDEMEPLYSFSNFGYDFAKALLEYMKINVEYV